MNVLSRLDDWIINTITEPLAWAVEDRFNIGRKNFARLLVLGFVIGMWATAVVDQLYEEMALSLIGGFGFFTLTNSIKEHAHALNPMRIGLLYIIFRLACVALVVVIFLITANEGRWHLWIGVCATISLCVSLYVMVGNPKPPHWQLARKEKTSLQTT